MMSLSVTRCLRALSATSLRLTVRRQPVIQRSVSGPAKIVSIDSGLPVTSALKFKARQVKKKTAKPSSGLEEWNVVGYSAAESLDLFGLQDALRQQELYTRVELPDELDPSCIYVYKECDFEEKRKDILLFKEGCVVFWNVPELERRQVLSDIKSFSENKYDEETVFEESEMLNYRMSSTKKNHFQNGVINILSDDDVLAKYTFSNAISNSVKLGSWEIYLENIIDSISFIADDLRRSKPITPEKNFILQKSGEILSLRHMLNLSSDYLDTPDFYWDREDMETLFLMTCNHLAVKKRTEVANKKLSYCLEIMEMINGHIQHEHGSKLEKIIIALIAVEILFEFIHFCRTWRE